MDAVYGASVYASGILGAHTGLSDHICHVLFVPQARWIPQFRLE
jgi:hypothetical protein